MTIIGGIAMTVCNNLSYLLTFRILTFIINFYCLHGMNIKNRYWFQRFLTAGKILVTVLTLFINWHYFRHQSWGYFTIDPKQPLINIYAVSTTGVLSRDPVLKNNMSYGMGVSREGIFLYNKLADVIASNKSLVWKKLNGDSLSFLVNTDRDIGTINYNDCNIGRGRFVITKTDRQRFGAIGKKNDFPVIYYSLTDIR